MMRQKETAILCRIGIAQGIELRIEIKETPKETDSQTVFFITLSKNRYPVRA
jgi:hypothetical protein